MNGLTSIKLLGRWYVQGIEMCCDCGKEFPFTLSRETWLFWDGLCSQCAASFIFDSILEDKTTVRFFDEEDD